ncbi:MAG: hypothetical protein WA996_17785 [Candidatus Promineifilaceae bacterium]
MEVAFIEDDLTDLQHVSDTFDLLVDYGTLDDLRLHQRDLYMKNVLPLTHQGSLFLLYCFEWELRWWERLLAGLGGMALEPGETERRFGDYFEIEGVAEIKTNSRLRPAMTAYLMTRRKSW